MGIGLESRFALIIGVILWAVIRSLVLFRGLVLMRNEKYKRFLVSRELIFNLFAIYCIAVISITLFPISSYMGKLPAPKPSINIVPIVEIVKTYQNWPFSLAFKLKLLLRSLMGNFLLLLPLGLFLPLLWKRFRTFRKTLLIGASVSLIIEVSQFILVYLGLSSGRATDIDDLILNTLGIMIGYILLDKVLVRLKWLSLIREGY